MLFVNWKCVLNIRTMNGVGNRENIHTVLPLFRFHIIIKPDYMSWKLKLNINKTLSFVCMLDINYNVILCGVCILCSDGN